MEVTALAASAEADEPLSTDPVRTNVAVIAATGVVSLAGELIPKLLELLHEMVPTAGVVGLLISQSNPIWLTQPALTQLRDLQAQATGLGLTLL